MNSGKRIPINWAKRIAEDLGYSQVIIHGFDGKTGMQCVTTYGKSLKDCKNAADGGNKLKQLLKWPEEYCNAQPKRVTNAEKKKQSLLDKNSDIDVIGNCANCGVEYHIHKK